jgi:hypothetical protein
MADGVQTLEVQVGGRKKYKAADSELLGTPTARMWKGSGPLGSKSHTWLLNHGNLEAQVLLLPTPVVNAPGGTPENHLRKKPGRSVVTDLAMILENGLLQTGGQLLPTPTVSDANGAGVHGDGGLDLRTAVTLLPTPTVGMTLGGSETRSGARSNELLLPGVVKQLAENMTPSEVKHTTGESTKPQSAGGSKSPAAPRPGRPSLLDEMGESD